MSFLATLRTVPIAGQNITFTFPSTVDTTTLQPGQAFDIRTYLFNLGIIRNLNITTRLNIIIPSSVTLGSSIPSRPVLTIAGFKTRDTITITNNGNISGAGGAGGGIGSTGGNGGNAIITTNNCRIINNGNISGGGGGGGGGKNGQITGVNQYGLGGTTCGSNCGGNYTRGTTDGPGTPANPPIPATSRCTGGWYTNCRGGCKCFNQTHYNCNTLNCPFTVASSGGNGGAGQGAFSLAIAGSAGGGGTATSGGSGGNFGNSGSNDSSNTVGSGTSGFYISGINFVNLTNNGSLKGLTV